MPTVAILQVSISAVGFLVASLSALVAAITFFLNRRDKQAERHKEVRVIFADMQKDKDDLYGYVSVLNHLWQTRESAYANLPPGECLDAPPGKLWGSAGSKLPELACSCRAAAALFPYLSQRTRRGEPSNLEAWPGKGKAVGATKDKLKELPCFAWPIIATQSRLVKTWGIVASIAESLPKRYWSEYEQQFVGAFVQLCLPFMLAHALTNPTHDLAHQSARFHDYLTALRLSNLDIGSVTDEIHNLLGRNIPIEQCRPSWPVSWLAAIIPGRFWPNVSWQLIRPTSSQLTRPTSSQAELITVDDDSSPRFHSCEQP